jgi:hypothetical protein
MLSTVGKALILRTYAAILYMAVLSSSVEFFRRFGLARADEFLCAGIWVVVPLVANMGRLEGWLGRSTEFAAISVGLLALPWVGLQNAPYWLVLVALFAIIQLFLRGGAVTVWAESPRRVEARPSREGLSGRLRRRRVRLRPIREDQPAEIIDAGAV